MKTIYKYTVSRRGSAIQIPVGAVILPAFNKQLEDFCFWAIVDNEAALETRSFEIIGTGWEIEKDMSYIGTYFDDPYVWHLMELTK